MSEFYEDAKRNEIDGRSRMTRAQFVDALQRASGRGARR
jgi:hypothetical protein